MKKGRKILAIIATIAVLAYVIYAVCMLILHPTDIYVVTQGTLTQEDETVGYIIRNEKIIKGEDYKNGIYAIASEGQRVSKDESIFRYYSDSEKEIKTQINGLNYKIQELLEKEKNKTSADIKVIEKEIEEKIQQLNGLTNYQEVVEMKKNIDNLITKKINFINDVTENNEIKILIKERNECEEKLKNGAEYQKAEMAGIVSYRVDGLEEKLTTNNFEQITEKYLEELDLKTGKTVSTSNECGKVIDNFKCYIAVTMKSKNAMQAKVGDTVSLRISNNEEVKAKIVRINEQSGKRTIIFELNTMSQNLIDHRKIIVDVIWWDKTGLKVPKQALVTENGLNYVIRNKAGIQTKLLVKVEIQTDKFAIITTYDKEELQSLGFSADEIKKYKKITNYDEIIINN